MNNGDKHNRNADSIITQKVQFFAKSVPDREVFVYYTGSERNSLTYQQLYQLAGKFAFRLRRSFGFKRNDIIANTLPNSPERLVTDLGVLLAGCIPMNGQILLSDGADFFQSARNSRCKAVILCPDGNKSAWRLMESCITRDCSSELAEFSNDKAPDMKSALLVSRSAQKKSFLEDLKNSHEDIFEDQDVTCDDLAMIFTTSGSTGYSKLVPRTHKSMMDMTKALPWINIEDFSKVYNDRPLGWIGGYPFEILLGAKCRVMLDAFDSHGLRRGQDMWRAITRERCLFLSAILPLDAENLIGYVLGLGGDQFRVKRLNTGGQPMRKSQIQRLFKIADEVLVGYGSTEAGGISKVIYNDPKDVIEDHLCGKLNDGVSVRIVNDEGEVCKPGQMGTLQAKGEGVFKGFFNRLQDPDPQTIKAFTKDGWLDMEDNGYFDEDGNLYVIGRNKDIIMYGGLVLYPGWLEAKIQTHPEVASACVVPVSDPVRYHNLCACVELIGGSRLTEDSLRAFCERIFVASTEDEGTPMPKFYLVMEKMPQTETGKPDKQVLKQIAEKKFGVKDRATNL